MKTSPIIPFNAFLFNGQARYIFFYLSSLSYFIMTLSHLCFCVVYTFNNDEKRFFLSFKLLQ